MFDLHRNEYWNMPPIVGPVVLAGFSQSLGFVVTSNSERGEPTGKVGGWELANPTVQYDLLGGWLSTHQREAYSLGYFEQVKKDAVADGLQVPSVQVIKDARNILNWMYRQVPYLYDVVPGDEGGVEIHAIHDNIYFSLALFENGVSKCWVSMDNERSTAVFDKRETVKGRFMQGALGNLKAAIAR